VFAIEGLLFLLAAVLALRLNRNPATDRTAIKTISGRNAHASA
jgi:hypothetical protein